MVQSAQQKTETPKPSVSAETISVRRFYMAELETHGLWLYDRLHDTYPHIAQNYLTSWIRGCMEINEFLFICTDKAAGLAQINHRPLEPEGFVQVIFVFTHDKDSRADHASALYREFKRWGKSKGCTELNYGELSDARQSDIKKGVGDLYTLPHYFTPLD